MHMIYSVEFTTTMISLSPNDMFQTKLLDIPSRDVGTALNHTMRLLTESIPSIYRLPVGAVDSAALNGFPLILFISNHTRAFTNN